MAEADAFPPSTPSPTPSSAEAAVAAVTAVIERQRAEADKRVADSEIIDPGQKHAAPESDDSAKAKPNLIEGASTSESVPESLIERAIALDYTEEEARAMSPAALRKTVVRLEKRAGEERREFRPEPRAEPEPEEDFSLPPINEGILDENGQPIPYDEKYLENQAKRDRLAERNAREAAELKKELQALRAESVQRQVSAETARFEKWIQGHEDLHDELGDGKGFPASERQVKACKSLWARTAAIVQTDGLSMEDAMEEAAAGMFRDKVKAKATKEMAGKLTEAAKQHSKRPGGSKPIEKAFGKERATEELTRVMAQRK